MIEPIAAQTPSAALRSRRITRYAMLLLASLLLWLGPNGSFPGLLPAVVADEEAPDDDDAPSDPDNGVQLDPETQAVSGIETRPLEPARQRPELRGYARVEDLTPLLALRSRYRAAAAEASAAAAALAASGSSYRRLRDLKQYEATSQRQLQQAESRWKMDQAQFEARRQLAWDLRQQALQRWGAGLTEWLLADPAGAEFQALLERDQVLLLLSLPAGETLASEVREILVGAAGDRARARGAERIAAAAVTSPLGQGETWYFRTPAERLRSGMVLEAWIPGAGDARSGVRVPAAAVIWHAGAPWIYLQTGPDRFLRQPLTDYRDLGGDWFVGAGLEAGQRVVVRGAQMLLSEEYRWQIPDEDDD